MSIIPELSLFVNDNFNVPLNKQITDREFNVGQLITSDTTWIAPKNGIYKIICVGQGGKAIKRQPGAGGGVVVEKAILTKGDSFDITFPDRTGKSNGYDTTTIDAKFGELCTAYGATGAYGGTGITSNGIVYTGQAGYYSSGTNTYGYGGSVGLYDRRYISEPVPPIPVRDSYSSSAGGTGLFGGIKPNKAIFSSTTGYTGYTVFVSGAGGYGGGAGVVGDNYQGEPGDACVYIELVEEL